MYSASLCHAAPARGHRACIEPHAAARRTDVGSGGGGNFIWLPRATQLPIFLFLLPPGDVLPDVQ